MGLFLCLLAFASALIVGRRSFGHGLGVTAAVGYFYGIVRANFLDGASHFIFDCAVLGLYASLLFQPSPRSAGVGRVRTWMVLLAGWPLLTILLSPLLPNPQPPLVQLVGLRASAFFLPCLLAGARSSDEDMDRLAKWLVALNLIVFVVAILEASWGITRFYPDNEATDIIYRSNDVGEDRKFRIPGTFTHAGVFGGTMLVSLPFLLRLWGAGLVRRILIGAAMGCTVIGIFLCAARIPVVWLAASFALLLLTTRPSLRTLFGAAVLAAVVALAVANNPRLQRFSTLQDTAYVRERVQWSVNGSFWEILRDYPMGNGLGSAFGTSIPYFLRDVAHPLIGIENEYGRILLEQGAIGLALWIAFLIGFALRPPPATDWRNKALWAAIVPTWATAVLGTGAFTSVPLTMLGMLAMGHLIARTGPQAKARTSADVPLLAAA